MSLLIDERRVLRVGAQRPNRLLLPSDAADFSAGRDAVEFATSIGYDLLDWQAWLVEQLLAEKPGGGWAAPQAGVVIPRQNGKNVVLEVVELYGLYVQGLKSQIHTAHEADTAALHMAELKGRIQGDDDLDAITSIYESNGKERIVNRETGGTLSFRTRTKKVKRGSSPQRVVFDEALYCEEKHISALVPAMAAQSLDPDTLPHMIFTSSAPLEESVVLHRLRRKCLEQQIPRMLWAEWSADPEVSASDVDAWYENNPSLGLLISEDFVRDSEFVLMSDDDFKAERLGVPKFPPSEDESRPIPLDVWDNLAQSVSQVASHECWALTVSPDRRMSSLGMAGRREDGKIHAECVFRLAGTDWIVGKVLEGWTKHKLPLRVHKSGPEASLIAPLREAGVEVVEVSTAELAQATGQLIDAANAGDLAHLGQPPLDKALRGAVLRMTSDGAAVWSQRNSAVEITPLQAVTVAVGGVPVELKRAPRIWSLTPTAGR